MSRLPILLLAWMGWTVHSHASPNHTISPSEVFVETPAWVPAPTDTDCAALGAVAADTARYLRTVADPVGVIPGGFEELGVSLEDTILTLEFIARVAEEDRGEPVQRLQDSAFLAEHLRFYRWTPPGGEDLRLTRYYVPQIEGRDSNVPGYDTPLYAVPDDERTMGEALAAAASDLLRQRYTRQQVLAGVYAPGGEAAGRAEPLVWLSRANALNALMQGTVEVDLPDGRKRTFNVHRNNGRPYVRGQSSEAQEAYWYFREVQGVLGWGDDVATKVRLQPGVSVAGDVWDLGLGKLIALHWVGPDGPRLRLVVLSDSGGAFEDNLGQLDLYGGAFPSAKALYAATAGIPQRVGAGVLVLRR